MINISNNNPKKSKALIITIVIVLLLLIIGYFLFTNSAKIFGTKGVVTSNKIFSPLVTSDSSKNLTPIDALAGEDLAKGDSVSVSGRDVNGTPIVVKTTTNGGTVDGYANQNINSGSIGPIVASSPSLWNSFTNFIGNMFGGNQTTNQGSGEELINAKANENILKGDALYIIGKDANGNPIVTNINPGGGVLLYGYAAQDIKIGDIGQIIIVNPGGGGVGTGSSAYQIGQNTFGSWTTLNNGSNGTFDSSSNGYGTWITTKGTGGVSGATWTGTGNGTGTWTSSNSYGTWTNGTGAGGAGTGTWGTLGGSSSYYNTANGWSYNYSNNIWTPPSSSNLPSVALTATSTSITSGDNTTIEWKSLKTISCNDDDLTGRKRTTSGKFNTGPLTTSTSFSVICVNDKGAKASGDIYITILNDYPSVSLTATPSSVVSGKTSIIGWESLHTISCNKNTTRAKTKKGSFPTPPLTTETSFSVTCIDAKGSEVSASINVGISTPGGGSGDYNKNTPIVTVTADPLSVAPNLSSDITWSASAENTTSCNDDVPRRLKEIEGTFNTGPLTYSKEFSVVCKGPNGSSSGNVTVSVIGENDPPIVSATATPSTVASGTKSTIEWFAENASSCNDDVTGREKTTEGSFLTDNIITDTSYTVSCIGAHGTGSATVYVFVSGVTTCPNGGTPPNCKNIPTGGSSSYSYVCDNGTDNYPDCTTINGQCADGSTNPPVCDNFGQTCGAGYTGTIPNCILETQTCTDPGSLEFTPEETAGIEALLRRYYALSDSIKTENDLISTNNDKDKTNSIINQAKTLTDQCTEQTDNPNVYTGPIRRGSGNPWYVPTSGNPWHVPASFIDEEGNNTYQASIWPINPFSPPFNTKPSMDMTTVGLKNLGFYEDQYMGTDANGDHGTGYDGYYMKKLYTNYVTGTSSCPDLSPTAFKKTYMDSYDDWKSLNDQSSDWKRNPDNCDEGGIPMIIESLFRIW